MSGHHLDAGVTDGTGGSSGSDASGLDGSDYTDFRYTDVTGKLTINVRTCAPSAPDHQPVTSCETPADFILIGGGAEILANPSDGHGGAVLTRSGPPMGCDSWVAASTDQLEGFVHQLRTYSIGMRLASRSRPGTFLSRDAMSSARLCGSTQVTYPQAEVSKGPPRGYTMVGGGVNAAATTGQGMMVVESLPTDQGWVARVQAIDPETEHGGIQAFAISFVNDIDDFGSITTSLVESTLACPMGHVCQTFDGLSPGGGVLSSIGGSAQSGLSGRYLTALVPFGSSAIRPPPGISLSTKDLGVDDFPGNDPLVMNQGTYIVLHAPP